MKFEIINKCLKYKQQVLTAYCLLCASSIKNSHLSICGSCLQELPVQTKGCCRQCGLSSGKGTICGHCIKSPPAFDATHAVYQYAYPVDALLQKYKYSNQLTIADILARLLSDNRLDSDLPDVLIPMPLHPQRLQERGFNQAAEIARIVAKHLQVPLDMHCCKRVKFAAPQVSLPLKQRVRNMRNAFICERKLGGLKIALLDDVMTTGASLNALAAAVKKAGAAHVECWVVARTQPHN